MDFLEEAKTLLAAIGGSSGAKQQIAGDLLTASKSAGISDKISSAGSWLGETVGGILGPNFFNSAAAGANTAEAAAQQQGSATLGAALSAMPAFKYAAIGGVVLLVWFLFRRR